MTRENIDKIHEITASLNEAKETASELNKTAQDRFGEAEHQFVRDGKEITVKEKHLWDEVYHLGLKCEAARLLAEKHPEVFAAYDKMNSLSAELKQYVASELGIDFTQMTLSDYLKVTEGLFAVMMDERK
jgi:hypothetical protein